MCSFSHECKVSSDDLATLHEEAKKCMLNKNGDFYKVMFEPVKQAYCESAARPDYCVRFILFVCSVHNVANNEIVFLPMDMVEDCINHANSIVKDHTIDFALNTHRK